MTDKRSGQAPLGEDDICRMVWEELASVTQTNLEELLAQADDEGDLEIDSRRAEIVIALVEEKVGLGPLATASDLEPENLSTVRTLAALLTNRINEKQEGQK